MSMSFAVVNDVKSHNEKKFLLILIKILKYEDFCEFKNVMSDFTHM